jgi:hypothetical protein
MGLGTTIVMYLLVGVGTGLAAYLSLSARTALERCFQVGSAVIFWPLYVPLLLSSTIQKSEPEEGTANRPPADELTQAIAQVDAELDTALRSLDGWAEDVLAREKDRLHELRHAWTAQAERIRDMDRLIGTSDSPVEADGRENDRIRSSLLARRHNLERLKRVRERTYLDLMGTLAWVRELVSMIHLAKFTGAPATRAEELVAQIAAAVEGLSALTWQDEAVPA